MKKRNKKEKAIMNPLDNLFDVESINEVQQEMEEIQGPEIIYSVRVTHPSLRIRKAPNISADIVGLITDNGIYNIYDEVNGWGQLEDKNWIMLSYTERI